MSLQTYLMIKMAVEVPYPRKSALPPFSRQLDTEDVPNAYNADMRNTYAAMLRRVDAEQNFAPYRVGKLTAQEWARNAYKAMQQGQRNIARMNQLHMMGESARQLMLNTVADDNNREYIRNIPIRFIKDPTTGSRGAYDASQGVINIDPNAEFPHGLLSPSIFHELGHAVDYTRGASKERIWDSHDGGPNAKKLKYENELTASRIPYEAVDAMTAGQKRKVQRALKANLRSGYDRIAYNYARKLGTPLPQDYQHIQYYADDGDKYVTDIAKSKKYDLKGHLGVESADAEYTGGKRRSVISNLGSDGENARWYRENRSALEDALRIEKSKRRHYAKQFRKGN